MYVRCRFLVLCTQLHAHIHIYKPMYIYIYMCTETMYSRPPQQHWVSRRANPKQPAPRLTHAQPAFIVNRAARQRAIAFTYIYMYTPGTVRINDGMRMTSSRCIRIPVYQLGPDYVTTRVCCAWTNTRTCDGIRADMRANLYAYR